MLRIVNYSSVVGYLRDPVKSNERVHLFRRKQNMSEVIIRNHWSITIILDARPYQLEMIVLRLTRSSVRDVTIIN